MLDPVLHVAQEGLLLAVLLSAPPALASLLVGLVTSVFQATTQLQDASISAVPRLAVVYGSIALAAPWIGAQLLHFTQVVFDTIALVS